MIKIFFIFFLLIGFASFSQNSPAKKEGYLQFKPFSGWRKDGVHFTERELKDEFLKIPGAIESYNKARTSKIIAYFVYVPGILFAFLSKPSTDITSPGYGKNKYGFAIAGIIFNSAGIFFLCRSIKNMKKAARLYNEKYH